MSKPFIPSSALLSSKIEAAMKACDHDLEQARLAAEARPPMRAQLAKLLERDHGWRDDVWMEGGVYHDASQGLPS